MRSIDERERYKNMIAWLLVLTVNIPSHKMTERSNKKARTASREDRSRDGLESEH